MTAADHGNYHASGHRVRAGEDGFAVIISMMALLLIGALGSALVMGTTIETMISRNFRDGAGALYAAEAAAAHGAGELSAAADWSSVLAGSTRSSWFAGLPESPRQLDDGSSIDLVAIQNLANCGRARACTDAEIAAVDIARPWGANNPRWQLFAYGRLADLLGLPSRFYVVLFVADDASETDGEPLTDGSGPGNPGSGVLMLRAESFGPGGAHAVVELTVARERGEPDGDPPPGPVRIVTWRAGG